MDQTSSMSALRRFCSTLCFLFFLFTVSAAPRKHVPNDMIVGGRDTTINRWPWQAGVLSTNGFNCGGTLIDYDTVLTAAHCVHGRSSDLFTVVLGENNREKWEGSEQYIKVDSYETHPEYKGNFLEGRDLALLHLSHNATHTAMVQSIPTLADETQMYTNEECFITGWGIAATDDLKEDTVKTRGQRSRSVTGMLSTKLQEAQIEIISNSKCNSKRFWDGMIKDTNICALYKKTAACDGDSGGPLVCKADDTFVLVGTISWGSSACKNYPTVFTGVGKFRNWIYSTMYRKRGFGLSPTTHVNMKDEKKEIGGLRIDCKASFVYNDHN